MIFGLKYKVLLLFSADSDGECGDITYQKIALPIRCVKDLILLMLISGILILSQSCKNEIDLFNPIDPIPLVYGLICPDDSILEIRLNRSFGADYNWARDVRVNDSLYYDNAEVCLDFRSDSGYILERVKFQEVFVEDKDAGLFSESPNRIYQAKGFKLRYPFGDYSDSSGDMTYYLTINIPEYGRAIFSQVNMPPKKKVACNISKGEMVNFYDYFVRPKTIQILSDREFATELEILVLFDELIDNQWIPNSIQYHSKYGVASGPINYADTIHFSPTWFYTLMKNRVLPNPAVKRRRFKTIDIRQSLVSVEIYNYQKSMNYQSDLYSKSFSNIVNGMGIFGCYSQSFVRGIRLNPQSIDSLVSGQYTRELNFISW